MHAHDFAQATHAGDERTSRDPNVREAARKRHVANAAEWLRRIRDIANQPEGTDAAALYRAYAQECRYANITPEI
jgi:hypothetical protein